MNEQIQKLADQAEQYAVSDNASMLFDVWKKRYTEKFAELIVQECAKVSKRTGALNEADFEGEMIADAIIEHFGIEP